MVCQRENLHLLPFHGCTLVNHCFGPVLRGAGLSREILWPGLCRYVSVGFKSILTIRSAGILVYGWAIFQMRLTMISARDAGTFGMFFRVRKLTGRPYLGSRLHIPRTLHGYTRQLCRPIAGGASKHRDQPDVYPECVVSGRTSKLLYGQINSYEAIYVPASCTEQVIQRLKRQRSCLCTPF